ncbi:N-terminal EF-hand calcium-binding protein 1 [Nerophis ophidion]|uniref:N-terminal EF-hand calcium-binding protein 1 n=1 Tax=Nerophis ophidion TaxID=159077 RepID=UPI002ADF19B4|nr:N-terminal EF-hand calcium-binding protein 1 [Nerophis ophidion]
MFCTEVITMCLQSAKRQQKQQSSGRELSILHDIFRRADKNDDGKLSFKEFNAYFADGVLTTVQLQELFFSIDGRQNNNLDTDKLSDFFSQHLGEYLNVLSALEKLNVAILKAMYKTKEEYQDSSVLDQFVTRFLLRETSSQLLYLQRSLQCAMEAVDEESSPLKGEETTTELPSVLTSGHRCGRGLLDNVHLNCQNTSKDGGDWSSQTARLQQLLDKLECPGPKLEPLKEDTFNTSASNILLVQRKMAVSDDDLDHFRKVLQSYVDATSAHSDNLHISVQKLPKKTSYVVYEFWPDRVSWMSYLQSNDSKDFKRCIIDMLEDAEVVTTMFLPASWWIMPNN